MKQIDIDAQLNTPGKSLIEGYLVLQERFEEKYGKNTVVLIEVGSFFEIYGVDNEKQVIGKPREIADILNLQLTRKSKKIRKNSVKNPLMAGFPIASFDRYVTRLVQEKKYTIVVIRQKGEPGNIVRYVDNILSPGVNIDYCIDDRQNYIVSIIAERSAQGVYTIGYAAVDVTTGKTYTFSGYGTQEDKTAALDEVFHLLQTHQPTEIVFISTLEQNDKQSLFDYLELGEFGYIQERSKRLSVHYQNALFEKAYQLKSFLTPIEFLDLEKEPLASESLAHLLEFIVGHDYRVIEDLKKPEVIDTSQYLYLGNNALEQLNIVSRDPHELTVHSLFDKTITSIGKRLFRERLANPVTSKEEILARYDLCDWLEPVVEEVADQLKSIYDLERIARRISLGRLHPFEINFLYESLRAARQIFHIIQTQCEKQLLSEVMEEIGTLDNYIAYLEATFDFDETAKIAQYAIEKTFFCTGVHGKLDTAIEKEQALAEKLQKIKGVFEKLLADEPGKKHAEYITVKQLDKEGHYISMTKSRYALIEDKIQDEYVSIDGTVYALADFSYKVQTSNVKITAQIMQEISDEIVVVQSQITGLVKDLFTKELQSMAEKFSTCLDMVAIALAKIDVAVSTIKSAKAYHLVRPEIIEVADGESYLSFEQLRHPLVESKEEQGIYVPNDIVLGEEAYYNEHDRQTVITSQGETTVRGVLLYGINSSGKSSLMKSMGVAVILAQSGLYVPAKSMRFSLCKKLFTRITSKDNFEKGLSSFAVEMMELKNILQRSGPKSLILADEISHGTETVSAISIVAATIRRVNEIKALFVFTTHLHQLHHLQLIQDHAYVVSVHLSVHYDEVQEKLIFDRTLQPGSGSSIYGLEFAQSLHMDANFLRYAMQIRKDLTNDYTDIELLTKRKTSKYHKKLYLTTCAICEAVVDEVHHITPQKEADVDGNIEHFHKDHKYNLLPICSGCHQKIHSQQIHVKGFVMTSQGLELLYDEGK